SSEAVKPLKVFRGSEAFHPLRQYSL
ncbi:hypothetical protein A2U01_0087918, partial [Trifolium medium]|nr:hypothetical protein [Trifolium medium]